MSIQLAPDVEAALVSEATARGVDIDALVREALKLYHELYHDVTTSGLPSRGACRTFLATRRWLGPRVRIPVFWASGLPYTAIASCRAMAQTANRYIDLLAPRASTNPSCSSCRNPIRVLWSADGWDPGSRQRPFTSKLIHRINHLH